MTTPSGPGAGPRVVAIGGGHGLAATLRAVRTYTDRVTALVSVADDGGSSGRLRELLHIIPPGDLRMCLVALAEPGSPLATAFDHRFTEEELAGHSLGNLILAGLIDGAADPVVALDEAGRLLGVTGRVLPATTEPVVLKADQDYDIAHVVGTSKLHGPRQHLAQRTIFEPLDGGTLRNRCDDDNLAAARVECVLTLELLDIIRLADQH